MAMEIEFPDVLSAVAYAEANDLRNYEIKKAAKGGYILCEAVMPTK